MPLVTLDPGSPHPPYEQVREQIRSRVERGDLTAGPRLPTVRALAGELGMAANAVARAHRELEGLGVIERRGRAGSVVTGDGVERTAREAARAYADTPRSLGLGADRGAELLRRAFD